MTARDDVTEAVEGGHGIFVSYRVDDSAGWSRLIHDHLVREFGREAVFMDVDSLRPGEDYQDVIERTIRRCRTVVVVIGRRWLSVEDDLGRRRIEQPDDLLAIEVATALEHDKQVIPVLVDGSTMPASADLPPRIRQLARRNALRLSSATIAPDVERLASSIHLVPIGPQSERSRRRRRITIVAAAIAALAGIIGGAFVWWSGPDEPNGPGVTTGEVRVLDGDLSVAIARFATTQENPPQGVDDLSLAFANHLTTELEERASIPAEGAPAMTVDVLGPSETGVLEGSDFSSRASRAQTVAERHHASTIVSADISEDLRTVQPVVFVAPASVPDALELSGMYAFGPPIVARSALDTNGAARAEIREALQARAASIAEFMMGLQRAENGSYAAANANFEQALELWVGESGRDIVFLFLGNTSLKQGDLATARQRYGDGQAATSEPSPRLQLALLEVTFHERRGECDDPADAAALQEVHDGYLAIQASGNDRPGPLFDLRVELGLARTAMCLAALHVGEFGDAAPHYLRIITAFEDGNDYVADIAGESFAGLALIADRLGTIAWPATVCDSKRDCYLEAARTAVDPSRQAAFAELANG